MSKLLCSFLLFSIMSLVSCSDTYKIIIKDKGKCPNETFYNNDSNFVSSKYVFYDKKFCFYTDLNNELEFYSIRTNENLENSGLYTQKRTRIKQDTIINKEKSIKFSDSEIQEFSDKFGIDLNKILSNKSIKLSLRAKQKDDYLYFIAIPVDSKGKIQYSLEIFAVCSLSGNIDKTYVYLCGDKKE